MEISVNYKGLLTGPFVFLLTLSSASAALDCANQGDAIEARACSQGKHRDCRFAAKKAFLAVEIPRRYKAFDRLAVRSLAVGKVEISWKSGKKKGKAVAHTRKVKDLCEIQRID